MPESPYPQGLNFALALPVYSASSRFFQLWGWIGAESAQCSPGTLPRVLGRDSHMCPLQPNTPAAFACPGDGMWVLRRRDEEGQLPRDFGGPQWFVPASSAQAPDLFSSRQKHVPADFRTLRT